MAIHSKTPVGSPSPARVPARILGREFPSVGASAYEDWLTLPGNAGKTLDEFLESLVSVTPGPAGPAGAGLNFLPSVATSTDLDPAYAGNANDAAVARDTGHAWKWTGAAWIDVGQFKGDDGTGSGSSAYPAMRVEIGEPVTATVVIPYAGVSSGRSFYASGANGVIWISPKWYVTANTKGWNAAEDVASPDLVVTWVPVDPNTDSVVVIPTGLEAAGLKANNLDQFADVTQTSGKTLTFSESFTIQTGAVTITGNVAGSTLTLGAGANVVQGSNTGDNAANTSCATAAQGGKADTAIQPGNAALTDSRPASDVYSWAKASTKPSYTYSEVGADAAGAAAAITLAGLGGITKAAADGYYDAIGAAAAVTTTTIGAATAAKFIAGAGALTGPASPLTIGTIAAAATGDYATSAKFIAGAGALTGPAGPLTIGTAAASAVGDFAPNMILRHATAGLYDYLGKAVSGSSESSSVWTILRITLSTGVSATATSVKWDDRLTATYA
jgi:hypothetical protein